MSAHPPQELSESEYDQMEEAISQTARGRAFLRQRDRRTRLGGIDELRRATIDLQRQVDRLRGGAATGSGGGGGLVDTPDRRAIVEGLAAITQTLQETRGDVKALRPADTGANRIDAATSELDAIVAATERATTDILTAAEHIGEWTQRLPRDDPDMAEVADAIEAWNIEIMTACSFQDITGQRTTKVVNTLRYIEQRVNTMIGIWGVDQTALTPDGTVAAHRKQGDERPDADLLNGPQLDGHGVSQDDIDSLFDNMGGQMSDVFDRVEEASPAPVPPPALPSKPVGPTSGGGGDKASQADIDALFG